MFKRLIAIWVIVLLCIQHVVAQTEVASAPLKTYRIGVFAPLFLDSIYSPSGVYKPKKDFPKNLMPGIDFIQGAQIALDSINIYNNNVDAYFFDTKSYTESVASLISKKKLDSLQLIIGSVKDPEFKQLAAFAQSRRIPFISATYPNDGGITNNPYLVILNSTLKAHCEAIFSYVLQNHGNDKILFCRKKGTQEDKVAGYFKAINEQDGKPLLKMQTINVDSSFSSDQLKKKLDSTQSNIIIGASLDENFATVLTTACYDLNETYPITLIGMPNWDGFKTLSDEKTFKDFPVYFTSPYYNSKTDNYSRILTNGYAKKYKGRPTDMAFKGFESVYLFTKLLLEHPDNFIDHINESPFKIFTDFNIKPGGSKANQRITDYYENKHLYFIKILNGSLSKAW